MSMLNSREAYGWPAIFMHWLSALWVLGLFGLGVWMVDLTYYDAWYHRAPELHKSLGLLFAGFLALRFLWALANPKPAALPNHQWWEKLAAEGAHWGMYMLMLVVVISGYLIPTAEGKGVEVFGWLTMPAMDPLVQRQADIAGMVHKYAAWALVGLATVHAAAALKHHIIDRDVTLLRMFGKTERKQGEDE